MNEPIGHDLVWTREHVARFWEYYSTFKAVEDDYFSKQLGDTVINFVKRYVLLTGKILDYGCGPGFLIEKLLRDGRSCWGLDSVESNIRIIESKFSGHPRFMGAFHADTLPTPIPNEMFDTVFLIETIEHLLPDELPLILKELNRITKTGGTLIITTPNNENLDANKVMCPNCGNIFHHMQHVNSWTVNSLSSLMAEAGFRKTLCTATTLRPRTLWGYYKQITDTLTRHTPQNLIYIGEKYR